MAQHLKTIEKSFNIIKVIQQTEYPTLTDISSELDLPKSTTLNYLRTLSELGYVIEDDGLYRLSLKFLDHGIHAKRRRAIAQIAPPVLEQLAGETNEAAWLMVPERGHVVGLEKALGNRAVQTTGRIGRHTRFHYHAPGKAMLSEMDDSRVRRIVQDHGLRKVTEHTITDFDELVNELEAVRERGVAFDVGEAIEGLRSIASPVVSDGTVYGAIAVVGPENRLTGDWFRQELPDLVAGAANEVELRLRYS